MSNNNMYNFLMDIGKGSDKSQLIPEGFVPGSRGGVSPGVPGPHDRYLSQHGNDNQLRYLTTKYGANAGPNVGALAEIIKLLGQSPTQDSPAMQPADSTASVAEVKKPDTLGDIASKASNYLGTGRRFGQQPQQGSQEVGQSVYANKGMASSGGAASSDYLDSRLKQISSLYGLDPGSVSVSNMPDVPGNSSLARYNMGTGKIEVKPSLLNDKTYLDYALSHELAHKADQSRLGKVAVKENERFADEKALQALGRLSNGNLEPYRNIFINRKDDAHHLTEKQAGDMFDKYLKFQLWKNEFEPMPPEVYKKYGY